MTPPRCAWLAVLALALSAAPADAQIYPGMIRSGYGGFGFAPLLGNPGEKLPADMIVPFDLLRERGAAIVGTAEEVAEQILKIKTECGFEDFNFVGWFEMGGFAPEEIEEQMHLFSEQVLPILRRECGPSPWQQRASNGAVAVAARA